MNPECKFCKKASSQSMGKIAAFNDYFENLTVDLPKIKDDKDLSVLVNSKGKRLRQLYFRSTGERIKYSAEYDCKYAACTNLSAGVCGGCKIARYCSDACIRLDWPSHKHICSKKFLKTKSKNENWAKFNIETCKEQQKFLYTKFQKQALI